MDNRKTLAVSTKYQYEAWFKTCLPFTCLRRTEAATLKWSDIDLKGKTFTGTGKGGLTCRKFPLHGR